MAPNTQILNIQVTADTAWQPQLAHQLMVVLCAMPELTLIIRSQAEEICWQIETPSSMVPAIIHSIYSIYPHAHIKQHDKTYADIGYYAYPIHATAPFFIPHMYASDCGGLDPLTGIVAAMGALSGGEAIVFSLRLQPPQRNYQQIGKEQITRRTGSWLRYLSPQLAMQSMVYESIFGLEKRTARFVSDLQHLAEQKIRMSLKEVEMIVKIRATTQARARQISGLLQPAMARFGRAGANNLSLAATQNFQLVLCAAELATLWHLPSDQCYAPGIEWVPHADVPAPADLTRLRDGIRLGSSSYQGKNQEIRLAYPDRKTHINLIGRTQTGKSTLLHNMIHQDILAGHGVGVIDPHGDLIDAILANSIPPEREGDVVLLDLNDTQHVIGLNLLAPVNGVPVETGAAMALAVLQKFFATDANLSRMEDTLYAALVSLMSVPGSVVQDIPRLFFDDAFRQQVIDQLTDPVALDFWHLEFERSSPAQRLELARPVNHRIRRLYRSLWMRRIMGTTTCLDFPQILASRRIFLANLRGVASVEGDALGTLLLTKLQMATMGRAQLDNSVRQPFYLYVDEVQNYVTSSLGVMLSEAAKYGMSMVIANQFLSQLEGKTLQAVLGNIGTNIIFRCSPGDAQIFAGLVRPTFSETDLVNLSRFRAVVKAQYQGQTLPAFVLETERAPMRDDDAGRQVARIQRSSRERYGRPVTEIDEELRARYRQNRQTAQELDGLPRPSERDYFD